jgi:putative spermidine/putrescine transport system permease protein
VFQNRAEALALALPGAIFAALVFVLPVIVQLSAGLHIDGHWSMQAYQRFFADPLNRLVLWRTLGLGALVTAVAGVIGYASAFAIVDLPAAGKSRMIGLVVLPLMISPVARTYAWLVILGRTGIVNKALILLGLTDEPVRVLFTQTAVFIGLLQLFLPLMVISLVSALENMPNDVIPAARVLGANWLQIFVKVVLPLTREGLVTGGTLVFAGSVTAYITPAILADIGREQDLQRLFRGQLKRHRLGDRRPLLPVAGRLIDRQHFDMLEDFIGETLRAVVVVVDGARQDDIDKIAREYESRHAADVVDGDGALALLDNRRERRSLVGRADLRCDDWLIANER